MKGYSGELMDWEQMNQHYLTKSIQALDVKIKGVESKLMSMKKVPVELQGLLASDDEFD